MEPPEELREPSPERQPRSHRKGPSRSGSPQRLRCQRRSSSSGSRSALPTTSERRNERERNRVKLVNLGFAKLRQHVPQAQGPNKKMSKVETLRSAVEYIRALQALLLERQSGRDGQGSDGLSPCSSSCSPDSGSMSLSPGSCSSSEESSREDGGVSVADFLLTLHGWA
ncbi:achaete-scute homolog 1-like [Bombina bombina]|uniref:achaete-scute homolog 1-like n=1 Tax=Bombina bombina TaxID=8345 RepID=UPI00235A6C89|nr:achaete-scute homolog 1-like [Bombina bombina]